MKLQHGFTATDFAIIATVLAMAAAFAVPRFASINTETRTSAVQSLAANVDSSATLSNKLWRTSGFRDSIVIEGRDVEILNGYPSRSGIRPLIVSRNDFVYANGIWTHKDRSNDPGCSVVYTPPVTEGGDAQVISYTSGC